MNKSAVFLLASLLIVSVQAQTPAPKPGPEHKKLAVFAGDWKYTGTAQTTPLGPGGKFVGTQKGRMILNGFFLECRWKDKGDFGDEKGVVTEGVELYGYDSVNKNYTVVVRESNGASSTGSMTVDGNVWRYTATRTESDGKVYQFRNLWAVSDDGKRWTLKTELSSDGTSWTLLYDIVMTKVRNAR